MKYISTIVLLVGFALPAMPAQAGIGNGRSLSPADRGIGADRVFAHGLRDLGPLNATSPVKIGVLLRYRNEAELESLVLAQGTKGSRNYHHFLTKEQFANYFAPDAATYARTEATLRKHGFRIVRTFTNRGMIEAVASAANASRYFQTSFWSVLQTGRGARYINASAVRMPGDLRADVVSLSGLRSTVNVTFPIHRVEPHDFTIFDKTSTPHAGKRFPYAVTPPGPGPDPRIPIGSPAAESMSGGAYGPDVYQASYDFPIYHGYGGAGRAVGNVIDSDFNDADAQAEFAKFNIPRTRTGTRVCVDPDACCAQGSVAAGSCAYYAPTGEETLDAEVIMSLAPEADFYEYLVGDLTDIGIEAAYTRAVSDDKVVALNSSFGGCETEDPSFEYSTNYIAIQGAALGITFEASSGDGGSTCDTNTVGPVAVDVPGADSYFVSVGGTSFAPIASGYYTGETAWHDGGGGVSVIEGVPSYQVGVANVLKTGRNAPDLAFNGDPDLGGYFIIFRGKVEQDGGTSVSSAMWAAMLSGMSEEDGLPGGFGLINPGIYSALQDQSYSAYFHDVTVGSNAQIVGQGAYVNAPGYSAAVGYDQTTGVGTPIGFELGAYLK